MAWTTPKTDWSDADMFTYDDINRQAGNINYLLPGANLKDDYTQDDVITLSEWEALLDALQTLIDTTEFTLDGDFPDTSTTGLNFNNVEDLTQDLYDWIELLDRQHAARIYAGDVLYTSARPENYARD